MPATFNAGQIDFHQISKEGQSSITTVQIGQELEWVLHSDIKLDNILLDENFSAKFANFGMAKLVE